MRKLIVFLFFFILGTTCLAQKDFNSYILNGDVKMKEGFYEMAMNLYQKAKEAANNLDEIGVVNDRMNRCNEAMNPQVEILAKAMERCLYRDQFLETGEVLSDDGFSAAQDGFPLTVYTIEIYNSYIVLVRHSDLETELDIRDIPSGTMLPVVEEDDEYKCYSSGKYGECFVISKKSHQTTFGLDKEVYHVVGDKWYLLYSSARLRDSISSQSKPEEIDDIAPAQVPAPAPTAETPGAGVSSSPASHSEVEIIPVSFTESWALNVDSDGNRLGDSRSESLDAASLRWLLLRVRYSCPDDDAEDISYDIRIIDPSGKILIFSGSSVKDGFSMSQTLTTIPGGAILNIAFGQDEPGSFVCGKYIVEIWYKGTKCYSATIRLE